MSTMITIPTPCHENWNAMRPGNAGRHCGACSKAVIDFTNWEPAAIAAYLQSQVPGSVCGRFHQHHLNTDLESAPVATNEDIMPQVYIRHLATAPLSLMKKIAAIIILIFGIGTTSCHTPIMREPAASIQGNASCTIGKIKPDTNKIAEKIPMVTLGTPAMIVIDTAKTAH